MKMASVKSKRKVMASSIRLLIRREHEKLEDVKAWQRPDTHRHRRWQVCQFGPQNREQVGLPVWVLKPGACLVRPDDG